jgi:P4 family phage/plasmid primase-like protien
MSLIPNDLDFDTEPEVKQAKTAYQSVDEEGNLTPFLAKKLEYYISEIERLQMDLSPGRETWIQLINEFASLGIDAEPYFMRVACISDKFDEEENRQEFQKAINYHKGKRNIGSFFFRCHEAGIKPYQKTKKSSKPESKNIPFPVNEVNSQTTIDHCHEGQQGLAELLAALVLGSVLFNHTTKRFCYYFDGRWVDDETKQFRFYALVILKQHLSKCASELDGKVNEFTKASARLSEQDERMVDRLEKNRDYIRATSYRLNQKSQIEAVLELASSILPTQSNDFDANPFLFNVLNGTLDFRRGEFRSHDPKDMLSKQAEVNYNKEVTCPQWKAFLSNVFNGDKDLISFVQQCVGYSLTGLTDLQVVLFCYGQGANGKSVFFSVLKLLLGEYCIGIPVETLLTSKQKQSGADYVLATLKGARAAIGSEIPQGRQLNESQMKDLTGGEPIHARKIYESPYSFLPTHKLWMFGNHKPVVRGTDLGIWRRIRLIPFTVTIPEKDRRPMSEMLAEFGEELPGILNWALDGYKEYYKSKKLVPPKSVMDATAQYQSESDTLSSFLQDKCVVGATLTCLTKNLYAEYLRWCESEGENPAFRTNRLFIADMIRRAYETAKGTGNYLVFIGISIKDSQPKRNN